MAIPFDPDEILNAIDVATVFILQETAKAVHRTVVLASPVGDPTLWQAGPDSAPPGYVGGNFRRNWQVGVGAAPAGELNDPDPSGGETIGIARSILESQVGDTKRAIYIVNNLPYAGPLNDGHSTQAPAGFVEQAVAAGIAGALPGETVL